jgi:adenylate kinase
VQAKRLIFLGPPGTGKGTQAARVSERFGLEALSSGDALRREVAAATEVGRAAEAYMTTGRLVPDEIVTEVMLAAIGRLGAGRGFILDGFPRTLAQAGALEDGLAGHGLAIDGVLEFHLDDGAIIERISSRRVCSQCGRTYNVRFCPPAQDGICDACGGPVEQRSDDRADVIATRLATFRSQTAPLAEYYRARGLWRLVEAGSSPDVVEQGVVDMIAGLGREG